MAGSEPYLIEPYLQLLKLTLTDSIYDGTEARLSGRDWPARAHTMIGLERLEALHRHMIGVLDKKIPGDFLEAGVWRGGACIFMRALLAAYSIDDRDVYVCDSFAGFPQPDLDAYPQDGGSHLHNQGEQLAVSLEEVAQNFRMYGLLDDRVHFIAGAFRDSLVDAPVKQLALLRLDGDTYEATSQCLNALYPKLSKGGILIVDDYGTVPACKQAVEDFRDFYAIDDTIRADDWTSIHWRKM